MSAMNIKVRPYSEDPSKSVKTVFKNRQFYHRHFLNPDEDYDNFLSTNEESMHLLNEPIFATNLMVAPSNSIINQTNPQEVISLPQMAKQHALEDPDTKELHKVIQEQVQEEMHSMKKYMKGQFENFRSDISEMFAKTKFMVISEFARFENQTYEDTISYLLRKSVSIDSDKIKESMELMSEKSESNV